MKEQFKKYTFKTKLPEFDVYSELTNEVSIVAKDKDKAFAIFEESFGSILKYSQVNIEEKDIELFDNETRLNKTNFDFTY